MSMHLKLVLDLGKQSSGRFACLSLRHANLKSRVVSFRSVALCHGNVNGKPVIVALLSELALFCTEKMWIGTKRKLQKVLSPGTKLGRVKRFVKVNCHGAGSLFANSAMEQDCIALSLLIDAKEIVPWQ